MLVMLSFIYAYYMDCMTYAIRFGRIHMTGQRRNWRDNRARAELLRLAVG